MRHFRFRHTLAAVLVVVSLLFVVVVFKPKFAHSQENQAKPGSRLITIAVNGVNRNYIVHVPANYNATKPTPVVIMLHGGGGTAGGAMRETEWTLKAEKEGFLAVFPNAMARDPSRRSSFAGNPQLWNDGSGRFYPDQNAPDDVAFIAAMLDDLAGRFSLDKQRVFVTGFSNGASMSFRVGAELSERIAAIAPVAGALWFDPQKFRNPVAMCYVTGTADPMNLIEGGVPKLLSGAYDTVRAKPKPPVRESVVKWANALSCHGTKVNITDSRGLRTETHSGCAGNSEVVYLAVEGLGHTWAGGKSLLPEMMVGKTSNRIIANDVIWDFFLKHGRSGN